MSVNPYTGREYDREAERELQRKSLMRSRHGLKVEWADYSTTIMDRARSRLRESAARRRRQRAAEDLADRVYMRPIRNEK